MNVLFVSGAPSHEFAEYQSAKHFISELEEPVSREGRRPTFVTHPQSHVDVHDGDPLTLKCAVTGNPKPKGQFLPSGPKAEIRLYDCNLFKTVLLVIYITNLYRRKFSTFYSIERRNSGKKTPSSLHEKKTGYQWTLFLIFCVDVHMGLDPSPRPHEPDPPPCRHHKWMALITCMQNYKNQILFPLPSLP